MLQWVWAAPNRHFGISSPNSREIFAKLTPHNEGYLAFLLVTTGPILLEPGYYQGHWEPTEREETAQESHISGYGVMAYPIGDVYAGYWKQGKRHGNGRLITAKGELRSFPC